MNYLAHIYLSYNNTKLEIGNFIADSVKGNDYLDFPETIKNGIILHRKIDSFTDSHPIVKKVKSYFSDYGHYAGVIGDIIFDHFLAKNWSKYHNTPLLEFTYYFYNSLENNWDLLPARVQHFYPYMKAQNWLFMYESISGISDILFQMNRRTRNISKMNYAIIELRENYRELELLFTSFFVDLENFTKKEALITIK